MHLGLVSLAIFSVLKFYIKTLYCVLKKRTLRGQKCVSLQMALVSEAAALFKQLSNKMHGKIIILCSILFVYVFIRSKTLVREEIRLQNSAKFAHLAKKERKKTSPSDI